MRNPLDPENWGDYPTREELNYERCQNVPCPKGNEWPRSRCCYQHATDAEREAIDAYYSSGPTPEDEWEAAVDAAYDATVDQDWGSEG
jgi:hypothetical protein